LIKRKINTRSDSTKSWATKRSDEEITDIYRGRTTKHQLGWTKLRYEAIADGVVLRKREKPIARIFHLAYLAQSRAARPLTFVFNGGPGAASAYLHMRALGPSERCSTRTAPHT
jgi:carboxypeptidase C (cathepsin A)